MKWIFFALFRSMDESRNEWRIEVHNKGNFERISSTVVITG